MNLDRYVGSLLALAIAVSAAARPTTHTIMANGNLTFTPSTVNAQSGDTITWTGLVAFHTVVQTTMTGTCTGQGSPLFGSPPGATTYSWVIPTDFTGQVFFKCNPHCGFGMRGTIIITAPPPPPCPGDADGNRVVEFADITNVLTNFGGTGPAGDADRDGDVDFGDVTAVLTFFGVPCP